MREVKFRAWNNDKKQMLSWSDLMRDKMLVYSFFGNESWMTNPPKPIWERMQFTGLKDNNGKEIYEGDIIEFDEKEWGGKDNIFTVTWDDKEACWSWGGGGGSSDTEWRKVIGNIYENPELLNNEL